MSRMTAQQKRERWIKVLLPAAVVVTGYIIWFASPAMKELNKQEGRLSTLRANPTDRSAVTLAARAATELRSKKESLSTRRDNLVRELLSGRGVLGRSTDRAALIQQVKLICREQGLVVREEASAKAGARPPQCLAPPSSHTLLAEATGKDRASMQTAIQAVQTELDGSDADDAGSSRDKRPQLWEVKVLGRYGQVLALLEALKDGQLSLLPASVQMEPIELSDTQGHDETREADAAITRDAPNVRRWSLLIWI